MGAQPATQAAETQILQELPDNWKKCRDAQGIFYYNSVTQESSEDIPPQLRAMMQQVKAHQQQAQPPVYKHKPSAQLAAAPPPAASPATASATVKLQLGDWAICEGSRGEFYYNMATRQALDQAPPELIHLYQQHKAQQMTTSTPQCGSYGGQPPAQKVYAGYAPQSYGQQQYSASHGQGHPQQYRQY